MQKALAEAIEAQGGIASFKTGNEQAVAATCNKDKDMFGRRADPIQSKIQKYVAYWKGYHKDETYTEKVLNRWGVKSAATRKKERSEKNWSKGKGFCY